MPRVTTRPERDERVWPGAVGGPLALWVMGTTIVVLADQLTKQLVAIFLRVGRDHWSTRGGPGRNCAGAHGQFESGRYDFYNDLCNPVRGRHDRRGILGSKDCLRRWRGGHVGRRLLLQRWQHGRRVDDQRYDRPKHVALVYRQWHGLLVRHVLPAVT